MITTRISPMDLPIIDTERCILTILSEHQAPLLQRYCLTNRAHLAPWEPRRDERFFTLEDTRARVRRMQELFAAGQAVHFAVLDSAGREMVASCSFSNIVRGVFQACHLGYSVAAAHEGRGLMHEALHAAIAHMFGPMALHRIMASHLPHNTRSARLLARLGFEREGVARAYLYIDGRWQDHVLNALVNPHYGPPPA
jgi:ribosomal-protein-alanine N-acetyltransferase